MKRKYIIPGKALILFLILIIGTMGCSRDEEKNEEVSKAGNMKNLGASAGDLLGDHNFTSLIIEAAYVPGHEPSAAALEEMKSFLNYYTHKPDGISIVKTAIDVPGNGPYSIAEVAEIEKKHRTYYNDGDQLAVFIFFANGRSEAEEDDKVILGTAYRNTSMVLFEETIRKMAAGSALVSKNSITSTTLTHEFGPLFGLVDNGSPSPSDHMDAASRSHCNVSGCLMTATVEFGKGAIEYIKAQKSSTAYSHAFDEQCRADLRANGGK